MPRRENSADRRAIRARSRERILIVCGGIRTEPAYFKGLRATVADLAVDVQVLGHGRSPAQIIDYATRRAGADFDDVWCVFDVDEFDIASAVRSAGGNGISLAISNPCFELWLLLHFADCTAHLPHCAEAAAKLTKRLPGYDKAELDFNDFGDAVADAVRRAKTLEPSGSAFDTNPSTSVWRLVEKITENDNG